MEKKLEREEFPAEGSGYQWVGEIGHGSVSSVWKVVVLSGPNSNKEMAIKRVNLEHLTDTKIKSFRVRTIPNQ